MANFVALTDANVSDFIGKKVEFTAEGYMMQYRGVAVINSVDYSNRKPLNFLILMAWRLLMVARPMDFLIKIVCSVIRIPIERYLLRYASKMFIS